MSSGTLVRLEAPPMSVESLKERSGHVQALIRDLMVEGVHFMVIPGTKERSLTKQGSEMLLSAFHIAVEPEIIETVTADFVRYTVKATGRHMGSDIVIGIGVGRCSSNEEKYKWRRAVCREEFDATPESHRRIKWGNGERGTFSVQQVRTNPEDVANTVLKMAKKRAQADLCLTALAASDAFRTQPRPRDPGPTPTQLREQTRARPEASPATTRPVDKSAAATPPRLASAAQLSLLQRKLDHAGISETYFFAQFNLGRFEDLPASQVDHCLAWIASQADEPPA